jgi:hypothetical protein
MQAPPLVLILNIRAAIGFTGRGKNNWGDVKLAGTLFLGLTSTRNWT